MARVNFPATGIVSGWLPVIVACSNGNYSESHVDIGTHVACLMAGEGCESGIILGAFYDDTNTPHAGNMDVTRTEFQDGTEIAYDRGAHSLVIDVKGSITIQASGNVTVKGANIYLN